MARLPAWMDHMVQERTGVERPYGETATPGSCRRCGAVVLRGMDDWPTGAQAEADPGPLASPAREAAVRAAGLATYRLRGSTPQTLTIHWRGPWDIVSQPIGTEDVCGAVLVLAQHRCAPR
jgi:hypothetical protein